MRGTGLKPVTTIRPVNENELERIMIVNHRVLDLMLSPKSLIKVL